MSAWGARQLARLGLDRPELRAWAMYDFANSAFITVVVASVFPLYFSGVAAAGMPEAQATRLHLIATFVGMGLIAVLAPFLGAVADYTGRSKRLLALFAALGVASTAAMFFVDRGDWRLAMVLFVLANIGAAGSFVFYDALLPHIAKDEEMDRVSSAGYALGYVGGGLLLLLNFAWIAFPQRFGLPEGTLPFRLAFLSVALWWVGFSIPLLRRVPEPPRLLERDESGGRGLVRAVVAANARLLETLRALRLHRDAFVFLLAFLIYNDGIGTVFRVGAIYAKQVAKIPDDKLVGALVLVQFVGVPCAFAFGALAKRFGPKRSILAALVVYVVITLVAHRLQTARDFYVIALLVALVQGGSQALSRSLFASMIPRHKSSEFFGFFGVAEKLAGILGPLLFIGSATGTGSSRTAVLSIAVFFLVGGVLLLFVNVERGRASARAADLDARPA